MEDSQPPTHAEPEVVEYTWKADDRPHRKRGIRYYFNIAAIGVVIFLILFFFNQYILIGVLFSLIFLGLVLATVPPRTIAYKITSWGIRIGQTLYGWDILEHYWYEEMLGRRVIVIGLSNRLPKRIILLYEQNDLANIEKALKKYTFVSEAPKPSWFDKRAHDLVRIVNWGQK